MELKINELEEILVKIKNTDIEDEGIINDLNNEINSIKTILQRNTLVQEEKSLRKPSMMKNIIVKYCKENNKCILTKDEQFKIQQKLYFCNNKNSISFVNALKITEIPYIYVKSDTEWKDIIIFPSQNIKESYTNGDIPEIDIKF